jgi:hypothetical protein
VSVPYKLSKSPSVHLRLLPKKTDVLALNDSIESIGDREAWNHMDEKCVNDTADQLQTNNSEV